MRTTQLTIEKLPSPRRVLNFEGGSISLADQGGRFYVIVDESTLAFLLDEEDLQSVNLTKIIEFDSATERLAYLHQRFPSEMAGATL